MSANDLARQPRALACLCATNVKQGMTRNVIVPIVRNMDNTKEIFCSGSFCHMLLRCIISDARPLMRLVRNLDVSNNCLLFKREPSYTTSTRSLRATRERLFVYVQQTFRNNQNSLVSHLQYPQDDITFVEDQECKRILYQNW